MNRISFWGLFLMFFVSSCNRGIRLSIDGHEYDYGKNSVITFRKAEGLQGYPPGFHFTIKSFKNSDFDSSFIIFGASQVNKQITEGDYSFPHNDRATLPTSTISFYDNNRKVYMSGGDSVYGPTFVITRLNKKRIKGWFSGVVAETVEDTAKIFNSYKVAGRFNVSLTNARYY